MFPVWGDYRKVVPLGIRMGRHAHPARVQTFYFSLRVSHASTFGSNSEGILNIDPRDFAIDYHEANAFGAVHWFDESTSVTYLLGVHELIFRGALRSPQ
jgi:hypothetical protein